MRGSGGTEGGIGLFTIGFVLSVVSLYFFFNSVQVTTQGFGILSTMIHRGVGEGGFGTASMGLIFLPFFLGVLALFYDSKPKWAWFLMWAGLGILVIEILSKLSFFFSLRASHLILLLAVFAAGAGMMLRSYRNFDHLPPSDPKNPT